MLCKKSRSMFFKMKTMYCAKKVKEYVFRNDENVLCEMKGMCCSK